MKKTQLIDEISLELAGKLDYLHLAAIFSLQVSLSIKKPGVDSDFANSVELAVSEAFTNAIKHSGTGENGKIQLIFEIYEDRLVTKVKDLGKGFDINTVPAPDFERHAEGGYGIYIMKTKMDEVEYSAEGDWNSLSMTKYFNGKR